MTLTPGTALGPYSITALIGTGGMGQVYRAHDRRLDRDVAIKVAAEAFSERFTREARAIAALNHTNICHLYDVGPNYLVMELVEGESPRGPLAFEEALPILRQLIDGIEAAHEKGIVHRDLKPTNIKITPDGVVKILDFGLAKAMEPDGLDSHQHGDVTNSPTIAPSLSMGATIQGTILGTAAYMAPEQAKGKQADRRSDIWSFGVVAYELLTGQRLFQGETTVEILGAVLNKDPDLSATPQRTQRLLRWCLERDRKDRLQAIGDARRLLAEEPVVAPPPTVASSSLSRSGLALRWAAAVVTAVALIGLATMSWLYVSERPTEQPLVHLSIPLPGNTAPGFIALSPDARVLVMSYQNGLGLRALDSSEVRPLAGTQGARTPFWSPDSRTIAFFADRQLKTVAASGGPPQTLCDNVGLGGGGTWNRNDTILFATEAGALQRVAAAGGMCTELTKAEPGVSHRIPVFLPDGDHFLYVLEAPDEARRGLYAASLGDPNGRRLLADPSSGAFVPDGSGSDRGRLLFIREQTLMAQPFDAASLQLSGDPIPVAEQVSFTSTRPQIAASAGMNGTLMYLANGRPDQELVWYDRSGKELDRAAQTSNPRSGISLAPDGKRVAFLRFDGQNVGALWLQDLERNQETRFTTPPLSPGAPVWSPDGQRVAFRATGAGMDAIYVKRVGGTEAVLLQGTSPSFPSGWSRDGRWLVYTEINPKTGADLWLLPNPSTASADRKPVPWLVTPFLESQGQISPDGNWLAYTSNESGRNHVYLSPFGGAAPGPDTKWQVSTVPSAEPRWRADGEELFYLEGVTGTRRFKVMSVPIVAAPNPIGTPTPLFEFQSTGAVQQDNRLLYSPSSDGQRFLISVYATEAQPSLEVLLNWGQTPPVR
ncbi:MAG: protein kinase domain-containing protein [Vicinamibacterales bacterium]